MPYYPPQGTPIPRVVLEETYTSWSFKGQINPPFGIYGPSEINIHVDEEHDVAFISWRDDSEGTHLGCWDLSDLSLQWYIPTSSAGYYFWGGYTPAWISMPTEITNVDIACSRNKYMAILRGDRYTVEIYNEGGLMQTINTRDYGDVYRVRALHFSRTAKYLFIQDKDFILVFEGS